MVDKNSQSGALKLFKPFYLFIYFCLFVGEFATMLQQVGQDMVKVNI